MPRSAVALTALVLVLCAPAPAIAQRCQAPQGTSAVDEYCETVPGARGDNDPGSGGPGISDNIAGTLTQSGAAGRALAQSLGNPTVNTPKRRARKGARLAPGPASAAEVPSSNPFAVVTRAVNAGTTVGDPFVIALLAIVLLVLMTSWIGYRRGTAK